MAYENPSPRPRLVVQVVQVPVVVKPASWLSRMVVLDTYDKLQRRLVALESTTILNVGDRLSSDGKRAVQVTSVSQLPGEHSVVALGFARREFWADGTDLETDGGLVTVREPIGSPSFS